MLNISGNGLVPLIQFQYLFGAEGHTNSASFAPLRLDVVGFFRNIFHEHTENTEENQEKKIEDREAHTDVGFSPNYVSYVKTE